MSSRAVAVMGAGAVLAALAILPTLSSTYLATVVYQLFLFFIVAQSFDLVAGYMGYVNLGHYVFFGVGAYAFCIALVGKVPLGLAFAAAGLAALACAFLLAYPLFRLRGDSFAFATLALLILFQILAMNLEGLTGGSNGISLPPGYHLYAAYYLALAVAAACLVVARGLMRSRIGLAFLGIREDEQAAEIFGVPLLAHKVLGLGVSGAFAGVAGGIQAWTLSYIDPPTVFGMDVALVPIAMALFGGSGTAAGPLVGVVALGLLEQGLWSRLRYLHVAVYGAILILVGLLMPGGIARSGLWRRLAALRPGAPVAAGGATAGGGA